MVGSAQRIMSLTIHEGQLLALINGGGVYRYEEDGRWTFCGEPTGSTQTYCAVTYRGQLYVGSWPEAEIIRYDGGDAWTTIGRVGYEREVMATALYNGKCYFGTLPMANVFRMDDSQFTYMGNLDNDPDYYLRRVWSRQCGVMATHDYTLSPGWRHVAAVRDRHALKLYLDGKLVSTSGPFEADDYDLENDEPLRIGHGIGHTLNGALRDVRLYNHAPWAETVSELSNRISNSCH